MSRNRILTKPHQGRRDVQTQRREPWNPTTTPAQPSALGQVVPLGRKAGSGERSALDRGVNEIGNQNAQGWAWASLCRQLPVFFKANLIKKYPGPAPSISCEMESGDRQADPP